MGGAAASTMQWMVLLFLCQALRIILADGTIKLFFKKHVAGYDLVVAGVSGRMDVYPARKVENEMVAEGVNGRMDLFPHKSAQQREPSANMGTTMTVSQESIDKMRVLFLYITVMKNDKKIKTIWHEVAAQVAQLMKFIPESKDPPLIEWLFDARPEGLFEIGPLVIMDKELPKVYHMVCKWELPGETETVKEFLALNKSSIPDWETLEADDPPYWVRTVVTVAGVSVWLERKVDLQTESRPIVGNTAILFPHTESGFKQEWVTVFKFSDQEEFYHTPFDGGHKYYGVEYHITPLLVMYMTYEFVTRAGSNPYPLKVQHMLCKHTAGEDYTALELCSSLKRKPAIVNDKKNSKVNLTRDKLRKEIFSPLLG